MRRNVILTQEPIQETALLQARVLPNTMGAAVYFLGAVRGTEAGKEISGIEYEAFEKMVHRQFDLIFDAVEKKWPVESVRLVHRLGRVAAGEGSVWIEVIAPHREEAYAASRFIIEEMKRLAPIWKKII